MSQRVLGKILEPLGCYQSNHAYLHSVQEQLKTVKRSLFVIEEAESALQHLQQSLEAHDQLETIREALVFLPQIESTHCLAEIKQRVLANQLLDRVLPDMDVAEAVREVRLLMARETRHQLACLDILMADIDSLSGLMEMKIAALPKAVVQWRWRERLGTPEAVHNCAEDVDLQRMRGEQLLLRLNCLEHSLQIAAH